MKRVTDAYARALFPNRYGTIDTARDHDGQPMGIAAGSLDLSVAAAVYRAVNAVEGLIGAIARRARRPESEARTSRRAPATTPLGCG